MTGLRGSGEVQVRLESLAVAQGDRKRLLSYLSENEVQRGKRLLDRERRDDFFVARGMLREALSGCLGVHPREILFGEGEYGKPRIVNAPAEGTLHFNVSHAGKMLLMVFAEGREVGCDLELVRGDLQFRPMAERYFAAREREELFSLPAQEQLPAFYRCWTRKEAYLKGTGTGFSQPSTSFSVSLLPHHPAALLAHQTDGERERWSIGDIEAPEGYCGAVAVQNL